MFLIFLPSLMLGLLFFCFGFFIYFYRIHLC
uniref:SCIMP protein n=1 Tax=Podoviridae sp. ctIKM86 TaxID=2827729 RepID=A0A8S5SNJ9_9CAUD|nr:MAG TPA: SCIMP protein [Podoviridae sp. ctIKM86]